MKKKLEERYNKIIKKNDEFEEKLINLSKTIKPTQHFLIGPCNTGGQGYNWANSLTNNNYKSESIRIYFSKEPQIFLQHHIINKVINNDNDILMLIKNIIINKNVILIESFRPLFKFTNYIKYFTDKDYNICKEYNINNEFILKKINKNVFNDCIINDLFLLRKMNKKVGYIFHGSDIRCYKTHAKTNNFIKYNDNIDYFNSRDKVSEIHRKLLPIIIKEKIPIFISTTDLYTYIPSAIWLPIVINTNIYNNIHNKFPIFSTNKIRVLYMPSQEIIKSTNQIIPILEKLQKQNIIEFFTNNGKKIENKFIPELIQNSDVVIDQYLGVIGILPIETIASGRIIMTYVPDNQYNYPTPPHINIQPDTLESSLINLSINRENSLLTLNNKSTVNITTGIIKGLEYANKYHNGDYSSKVIIHNFI